MTVKRTNNHCATVTAMVFCCIAGPKVKQNYVDFVGPDCVGWRRHGWRTRLAAPIVNLMLDIAETASPPGSAQESVVGEFAPFEVVSGDLGKGLILLCDHARNSLPTRYGLLGLPASEFERHIAYDIGVEAVTRNLAQRLGVPAVLSRFSRLLIDPNRGHDDPTLIMRLSDGVVVPGNAEITLEERDYRKRRFYQPYHDAITEQIDKGLAMGVTPALLSIHSFTPTWKGVRRPWHAGLLSDAHDKRFTDLMIAALRLDPHLVVGDNEPYRGGLAGDTIDVHGTRCGLASALLEIRQDLISDETGIEEWSDRLVRILPDIVDQPQLHQQLEF